MEAYRTLPSQPKQDYIIQKFSNYLSEIHGQDLKEENAKVLREWQFFKKLLQEQPREFDKINKYFQDLQYRDQTSRKQSKGTSLSPARYYSVNSLPSQNQRDNRFNRSPDEKYSTTLRRELLEQLQMIRKTVASNSKSLIFGK